MIKQSVCLCGCFQLVNRMFVAGHNKSGLGKHRIHSSITKKRMAVSAKARAYPLGSKFINQDGYVIVKTKEGQKLEHRLVMGKKLGRKLTINEIPHHRNENKADNRQKNLRLMTRSNHTSMHRREAINEKSHGRNRVQKMAANKNGPIQNKQRLLVRIDDHS